MDWHLTQGVTCPVSKGLLGRWYIKPYTLFKTYNSFILQKVNAFLLTIGGTVINAKYVCLVPGFGSLIPTSALCVAHPHVSGYSGFFPQSKDLHYSLFGTGCVKVCVCDCALRLDVQGVPHHVPPSAQGYAPGSTRPCVG